MKTALITGITGQDGAYLTEFLLKKGYFVTRSGRAAKGNHAHACTGANQARSAGLSLSRQPGTGARLRRRRSERT
ncbi:MULTISPECIES: GDP-mannose 4,6-dehydratase [Burkholderia]|uniref:GDP-mannose 4,6-dehydratase n=1 Tax=Burkholderia TaxID=32008 RepID=UPI002FBDEE2E